MVFFGSCTYSIDAKNRVFIPARYREDLGNTFYITRGIEACLTMYTEEEWALFLQKLDRIPNTTGGGVKEYFMSAAQKCVLDSSGRILLEGALKAHAQINKNMVFVGASRVINIWSEENWALREANRDKENYATLLSQYEL